MRNPASVSFCAVPLSQLRQPGPPCIAWSATPSPLVLRDEDIHLWLADCDDPGWQPVPLAAVLDAGEQDRAARFHFDRDRHRYIVRRALLREIIAGYLAKDPAELRFTANARGKPELTGDPAGSGLQFNLSTTGPSALYGFTRRRKIGIDIEETRREVNWRDIASQYFHPHELAVIQAAPESGSLDAFFAYWTMKEAWIKARGAGLQRPLLETDFTPVLHHGGRLLKDRDGAAWLCATFPVQPHYTAALCVEA